MVIQEKEREGAIGCPRCVTVTVKTSVGPKPLKRAPQKPKALQRAKAFGFKGL